VALAGRRGGDELRDHHDGADELMRPIHKRMPVIIPKESHDLWLDPQVQDTAILLGLLKPYAAREMGAHPVSKRVNSPGYNAPDCIKAISQEA
jgi:putative SOS response-associated peptidase YedK